METLDLSQRGYTHEHMAQIERIITSKAAADTTVTLNVDLSGNYLNKECITRICSIIESYPNVNIDLSVNYLGLSDFTSISKDYLSMFHEGRLTVAPTTHHRAIELLLSTQQKTEEELQSLVAVTRTLESRKDPTESVKQMKCFIDTGSQLIEEAVSCAVANILDEPTILHSSHYSYAENIGDVDGVVIGKYLDQDVIVFCEAKHNMDSSLKKAKSELFSTYDYWQKLISLSQDEIEEYQRDIEALCVNSCRHRTVYFAFGGAKFSDSAAEKLKGVKTPWFRVSTDPNGRFRAQLANY